MEETTDATFVAVAVAYYCSPILSNLISACVQNTQLDIWEECVILNITGRRVGLGITMMLIIMEIMIMIL